MAKTLQQQIIDGLLAEGGAFVQGRSIHYTVLTRTRKPSEPFARDATGKIKPEFWYVGKKGGLRTGTSLSDSFSAPAKRKQLLTAT